MKRSRPMAEHPGDSPANPGRPTGPANTLWRRWTGPLTDGLSLKPGPFGLGQLPERLQPETVTRSICGYCSTGCSLDIHRRDGEPVNLTPTAGYPVNLGMACPKGWEALTPLAAPDRGTTPLIRDADGRMQPAGWDEAMRTFTTRMRTIMDRHGRESVAFLSTGQMFTEEMAFLGTLFKFGMGGLDGDSNTRQCMATSHVAYKQSLGFDAPPFTYGDFETSDVLIFIGSNLCIAHPILWQRVLRNPNRPEIIVIDPRLTETAMNATLHLPIRPKSDLGLLYGVANVLIQNDWIDREFIGRHTTGFDEFATFVRQFTPDKTAATTGLTVGQIFRLAESIHRGRAVSFWWTMGVNQGHESTRTAQAIINLSLMTGQIGRPGTGPNSVTGQCNAMGSRLFANVTGLPGGRDFANPTHRSEIARLLNIPADRIPERPSLAYDQILDRIADGRIKALWVIATNPAHSWISRDGAPGTPGATGLPGLPGLPGLEPLLQRLEFLAVQDLFTTTETARHAHLYLPAAGWGEKEGTFINSERRIGVGRKVARAPGQALSDFNIFRLVADYWGCSELFQEWRSPEAAFHILRRLSADRPCDFTGIANYQHLEAAGGIQWPLPTSSTPAKSPTPETPDAIPANGAPHEPAAAAAAATAAPGDVATERRLFADGRFFTADGRARFHFDPPRAPAEVPDAAYPFVLLTGRGTSAQWHTNTRTGKSAMLRALYPAEAYVEVHPDDAARLGIAAGDPVRLSSRRGTARCAAFITATVQIGQVFIPMHYEQANRLTLAEFDPHSRQPSYKHCAVRLERDPNPGPGSNAAATSVP